MRIRNLGLAVGAAVALTAAVAGCGSSSTGSTAPGGSSSAPTGEEIRIGVIGAYSGAAADAYAGSKQTVQAWAEWVNANGGLKGHPVKLFIEDDSGNVQKSIPLMKKLVEEDKVVAIVGQVSTTGDSAWAPYLSEKGIPVIGGTATDAIYLKDPNFFAASGNLISDYYGVAELAKARGDKVGALYCAEVPACAGIVTILSGLGSPLGVDVTYSTKVAASAPDYTAACQGLKGAAVQSYSLGASASVLKRVAPQCKLQGVTAPLITLPNADATFEGKSEFEGLEIVDSNFPYFDRSIPATQEFHAALEKYAPGVGGPTSPLNHQVALAWVSGKLFEAAVKAAPDGPITSASIKKGLYALKGETLGGLSMPLTFKEGVPNLFNCYYYYKIDNGKFVQPNGLKPICAPDGAVEAVVAKINK